MNVFVPVSAEFVVTAALTVAPGTAELFSTHAPVFPSARSTSRTFRSARNVQVHERVTVA